MNAITRMQAIDELLDAEQELREAWDEATTWVCRHLEGWDDPESKSIDAVKRLHDATRSANTALKEALSRAGLEQQAPRFARVGEEA